MNISEEIEKLQKLRDSGAMTEDEFNQAKARLLNQSGGGLGLGGGSREQQTRQWAMFLHLSLLAGFVVPLAGLVLPIVIWQVKKQELPELDVHGKMIVNWILSLLIYTVVGVILTFLCVGAFVLIALGVIGIVFPIIGGIKANNGELWKYPLTITFIK